MMKRNRTRFPIVGLIFWLFVLAACKIALSFNAPVQPLVATANLQQEEGYKSSIASLPPITSPIPMAELLPFAATPQPVLVPVTIQEPTPTPQPVPTFPSGTFVAGVDISGLTRQEALNSIHTAVLTIEQPLELAGENIQLTVDPATMNLKLLLEDMLDEAVTQSTANRSIAQNTRVNIPLRIRFDDSGVRQQLIDRAKTTVIAPQSTILTETLTPLDMKAIRFAYIPGRVLDIEDAMRQVGERLYDPQASRHISLRFREDPFVPIPHPSPEEIQRHLEAMTKSWKGVIGFYLYDLQQGTTIAHNARTVFSGASVMKVAIMLHTYVRLSKFTEQQQRWLRDMIIHSSNISANYLLASSIGGRSLNESDRGALQMSKMLEDLGFFHTYLHGAYEISSPEMVGVRYEGIMANTIEATAPAFANSDESSFQIFGQEGEPPYTNADQYVRTTPAEIGTMFLMIDQCSKGIGPLLQHYPETLNADRCQEMLDLLAQNGDASRMRAGMPDTVRVEHKSGWIDDMQADVGIVRSPGGAYILAIHVYDSNYLSDSVAKPIIANLARLAYTAYNPMKSE